MQPFLEPSLQTLSQFRYSLSAPLIDACAMRKNYTFPFQVYVVELFYLCQQMLYSVTCFAFSNYQTGESSPFT